MDKWTQDELAALNQRVVMLERRLVEIADYIGIKNANSTEVQRLRADVQALTKAVKILLKEVKKKHGKNRKN
jgi:hypothetical protein